MIFFKGILGSIIIWIISWLSKSKNYFIAGLVPLFPTFALLAHFIIYSERGVSDLKQTILWNVFFTFIFCLSYYNVFLYSEIQIIKKYFFCYFRLATSVINYNKIMVNLRICV